MKETTDCDSRTFPFTIRISLRERMLLMAAARKKNTDQAKIARMGLDPLFARLADDPIATASAR